MFSILRSLVINVYMANLSIKYPADFDVNKSYQHLTMMNILYMSHCFISNLYRLIFKEVLKPYQRIVRSIQIHFIKSNLLTFNINLFQYNWLRVVTVFIFLCEELVSLLECKPIIMFTNQIVMHLHFLLLYILPKHHQSCISGSSV